ncbi:uncharacterized protein BXZ73DRAFT_108551 [Epithele typhae]|uniref:uncharacterized protein n=1 Tax=Epithele typhae TaxID=378194 RepID=UPI002007A93E|nr:uncharacterized protein BXZ73DRAFT_108551 [Epithele typhae]KAH9910744.1 hypothetical protein BXZ73DRAFT_108551 [Epithele typhae]
MKYNLRILVPSLTNQTESNHKYRHIPDVSFTDWEAKTAPKKLIQLLVPSVAVTVYDLVKPEPPVSAEELPPWVFYVDHYSAHTSVPLPKAQDFRSLPSTFRSVIHPGDRRTRLPLWLVDLWRQLRDIDTHRRNIVSGLHWLHRFQEQNDLDYNIFGEAIWPIFLRPALLHPWCDIFTSLITDHRDINDEVMDAATAVVKFKADALGGTQHYYSSLISQLQPVDLVDLFSKRAAQGDFTVDSIIYIPWILGDHWIFAIINIPGRDICIGDTTHRSDHDGQLEVAKRTMSRIAHAVEASVSQTRTDWYVQEYKFRCGIQDTPFPSGVAIAVTLVGAVVDEAKPLSSEHEDSHRIAVFFEILENLPTKHVDPNSYQKSVWELEDDRDVSPLDVSSITTESVRFTTGVHSPTGTSADAGLPPNGSECGNPTTCLRAGSCPSGLPFLLVPASIRTEALYVVLFTTGLPVLLPSLLHAGIHAGARSAVLFTAGVHPPARTSANAGIPPNGGEYGYHTTSFRAGSCPSLLPSLLHAGIHSGARSPILVLDQSADVEVVRRLNGRVYARIVGPEIKRNITPPRPDVLSWDDRTASLDAGARPSHHTIVPTAGTFRLLFYVLPTYIHKAACALPIAFFFRFGMESAAEDGRHILALTACRHTPGLHVRGCAPSSVATGVHTRSRPQHNAIPELVLSTGIHPAAGGYLNACLHISGLHARACAPSGSTIITGIDTKPNAVLSGTRMESAAIEPIRTATTGARRILAPGFHSAAGVLFNACLQTPGGNLTLATEFLTRPHCGKFPTSIHATAGAAYTDTKLVFPVLHIPAPFVSPARILRPSSQPPDPQSATTSVVTPRPGPACAIIPIPTTSTSQ